MLLVPASANGDPVTSVIMSNAQREWLWVREWTIELVRFCLEDAHFGDRNRDVLQLWTRTWNAEAEAAAGAVAQELERVPRARPVSESLEQLRRERDAVQRLVQDEEVTA
jgi:hypothetical protein